MEITQDLGSGGWVSEPGFITKSPCDHIELLAFFICSVLILEIGIAIENYINSPCCARHCAKTTQKLSLQLAELPWVQMVRRTTEHLANQDAFYSKTCLSMLPLGCVVTWQTCWDDWQVLPECGTLFPLQPVAVTSTAPSLRPATRGRASVSADPACRDGAVTSAR